MSGSARSEERAGLGEGGQAADDGPVWVWGLPLVPWTMERALDEVERLIAARRPSYFITANLYYALLTERHGDLDAINRGAAFVLADGMPLVWGSRWRGRRLPERVAGSDMIFHLAERAAARGYRLFFLGGAPGVGEAARGVLEARYPGLRVVGVEAPDLGGMSAEEMEGLCGRIRAAGADVLFVALGQPKGERWIARHFAGLNVPVSVQVGATLDFVAGRVKRAPKWMQKSGVEWVYRLLQEPGRLGGRYFWSAWFLLRMLWRDLWGGARGDERRMGSGERA